MIELKTNHGKTTITGMSGTIAEILSDLTCMIQSIHSCIAEEMDEECADFFEHVCTEDVMNFAFAKDDKDTDDCKQKTAKCDNCIDKDKVEKINVLFNQIVKEILD
jgi:hypothetical protein